MARPQTIEDDVLIARLSGVFRAVGYAGASLSLLTEATGLQKASLYHRFPGGKQQMAEEVIVAALNWYKENVFAPLAGDGPPRERLVTVTRNLDEFYQTGGKACLLNMLAVPVEANGPFAAPIRHAFNEIIASFSGISMDAGHDPAEARVRAERAVMLLHGSLVLSRGLGSSAPFRSFLAALPAELLGD